MTTAISAIVLAGGESRRMGSDKRSATVKGRPLIALAIDLAAAVSDDVVVSCRHGFAPELDEDRRDPVRLVFDRREGGPLAGLEAALEAARHDLAVVVPVDMPGLTVAELGTLIEAIDAHPDALGAVFEFDSGLDPFPGVYRRSILPTVTARVDAGELRVRALLAALEIVCVPAGVNARERRAFLNVNTPADLARAEEQ
jgi:molybdopterin-guanine dinucleotide biosynthesis protein A